MRANRFARVALVVGLCSLFSATSALAGDKECDALTQQASKVMDKLVKLNKVIDVTAKKATENPAGKDAENLRKLIKERVTLTEQLSKLGLDMKRECAE